MKHFQPTREKTQHWFSGMFKVFTWTSNSIKSISNLAASLKEVMVFSLIPFILGFEDCSIFTPLPLCPIIINFLLGNLQDNLGSTSSTRTSVLPSKTKQKERNPCQNHNIVQALRKRLQNLTFGEAARRSGQCSMFLDEITVIQSIWNMYSLENHFDYLQGKNCR